MASASSKHHRKPPTKVWYPEPEAETENGKVEVPPGFSSEFAYRLYCNVTRAREADPEGWARRDAQIRWEQENGLFEFPFNSPPSDSEPIPRD